MYVNGFKPLNFVTRTVVRAVGSTRCMSSVGRAQAALYTEPGDPSQVLRVAETKVSQPLATDVVVRMLAAPINPSDLNQIEGTYPVKGVFTEIPCATQTLRAAVGGNEGVGEVVVVGSGVSGIGVGDWVVPRRSGQFGTWCTHTTVSGDSVDVIPEEWRRGVSGLTVASLKVNPCTAYRMLRDFCTLQPGDYVVQNGANSGVGRSVIQLAREIGVRTINVIRDRPQREFEQLSAELTALGADIVVSDKQVGEVKGSVNGPVRLGFNCVGGRATLAMTKLISHGGTLVTYGGMSRQPVTLPTSLLLFKDIAARGFWMNRWYLDSANAEEKQRMWRDILLMAGDGRFVAQPMQSVRWSPMMDIDDVQQRVRSAVAWDAGSKHAFVFD
ncbi:mitochondrial 2-enoyl thioester reductase [Coemansia sp. RSA 1722]|nr:mitochondrial 2-enoyl thioester reductase [Coemansia sp. RSA 485]KAJ2598321.1 mitochondrial 2-enoyl thioester reductase [Coemansia sp. RSA 1721]KAJ2604398.1 mitochondrial 2-enoyl thioester reductase [Coemansia sp. RSA 1722]